MASDGARARNRDAAGEAEAERLRAHIRQLEALVIRRHDTAAEAEARSALRQEALAGWVAETENRIARIEEENARLRTDLDALHASTSWRVTAPLRWIGRRLRR